MDDVTHLLKETLIELFRKANESDDISKLHGSAIFSTTASHLHAMGYITDQELLQSQENEVR